MSINNMQQNILIVYKIVSKHVPHVLKCGLAVLVTVDWYLAALMAPMGCATPTPKSTTPSRHYEYKTTCFFFCFFLYNLC